MGIFKKLQGKGVRFTYFIHVHELSWPTPPRGVCLCVRFERGAHTGSTRAVESVSQPSHASYVFEEQMQLPATLYQHGGSGKGGSKEGLGTFQPKLLQLTVVPADARGKPAASQPLAAISLNLADYASTDGRVQEAFVLAAPDGASLATPAGAPKLLLTIACRDASHSKGGGPLAVEPSGWSQEPEGVPLSLSTDDETDGSRPSSRGASRADGAAGLRASSTLAAVAEEAGSPGRGKVQPSGGVAGGSDQGSWRDQRGASDVAAVAAPQPVNGAAAGPAGPAAGQVESARYDEDGFLIDEEESGAVAAHAPLEPSTSVRRNLGSALERAEASEGSAAAAAEVQSRLASGTAAGAGAGGAAGGGFAMARLASGRGIALALPTSPPGLPPGQPESPPPLSAGQQSSLSVGGDPAVPFAVPPSTQRRFAQRGDAAAEDAGGGAVARRWAWRRDGGGASGAFGARAAGGPGVSVFQRARVASAAKQDAGAAAQLSPEASGLSATTDAASRRSTAEEPPAGGAAQAQRSAFAEGGPHPRSPSGEGPRPAAGGGLALQRSLLGASGRLRPGLALFESGALPSPADQAGSAVVEALLHELRSLAALESAVYLVGGRATFAGGGGRALHAPARRLARTILQLGPQEGLPFGLQAVQAVQAVAGAGSGDVHRLTFWWSNVLQLRCSFSTLCQGLDPVQAATAAGLPGGDQLQPQGSEQQLPPRAELAAAAAAARGASAGGGLGWMQALLPHLRDLEAWLFGEVVKHLWWRVLLPGVTTPPPHGSSPSSSGAAGSSGGGGGRPGPAAPFAAQNGSGGGEAASSASLQGTPRSFETPEEEALQQWVDALGAVERAVKQADRPAAAPRPHLALLHRRLIAAVLRRLDTLLFRRLLLEDGDAAPPLPLRLPSLGGQQALALALAADELLGAGADAAAAGLLDPSLLPHPRGPLTFATGVSLKMAVSRLQRWAADCGVREERLPPAGRSTEMSDYRLFPCLRATADLLMMPKQVLADPQMRREVVPGLPLHRVCQLLERFEPDESAPDPLPPGLLEGLQSESPRSDGASTPSPTAKPEDEYAPPDEAMLLADGVVEPMSLDMGEESDDELHALAALHAPGGGDLPLAAAPPASLAGELRAQRFALLRDLWAAGAAQ